MALAGSRRVFDLLHYLQSARNIEPTGTADLEIQNTLGSGRVDYLVQILGAIHGHVPILDAPVNIIALLSILPWLIAGFVDGLGWGCWAFFEEGGK
jgi:hypothetical protein